MILPLPCSFSRDATLVLVDAVLSPDALLFFNDAGPVDLGLSVHASLNTCLMAFPTDDLLGLLGILNLGFGSSVALMLGMLSFLVRMVGLGLNLSTGLEVLVDLLDSELDKLDSLLRPPLLDLFDPDPDDIGSAICSSILSRCSCSVLSSNSGFFYGSGSVSLSESALALALLLGFDNTLSPRHVLCC